MCSPKLAALWVGGRMGRPDRNTGMGVSGAEWEGEEEDDEEEEESR